MDSILFGLIGVTEQISKLISGYAKSIVDLRGFAILSSMCGAILNALSGAWPQFMQNILEVPMHSWRLHKTRCAMREIERAEDPTYAVDIIKKLATKRSFKTGEIIFSKGDVAHAAYVVDSGDVKVVEPDVMLSAGHLFGEMGLFIDSKQRMATTVAMQDVVLFEIAYENFETLYRKNPEIGFAVMRLMSKRFSAARAEPAMVGS
jgi:CRP/FNR family transcriptional regulator, cyclic AMP receptor protein